jgi:RimJ/RimL family protein N-acetyltransferase
MTTPELQLQTLFVLDGRGRIVANREPGSPAGPLLFIARSATSCAAAVRADLPEELALELEASLRQEPCTSDLRQEPAQAAKYRALLARFAPLRTFFGPAFSFPEVAHHDPDIVRLEDERLLAQHFNGWVPGEIAAGRAPVLAIAQGAPVSVCFSARLSESAAEAGVETAAAFRGKGYAARVTAAWARAVRDSGRIPLYSCSWANEASLATARKLGLVPYASDWNLGSAPGADA